MRDRVIANSRQLLSNGSEAADARLGQLSNKQMTLIEGTKAELVAAIKAQGKSYVEEHQDDISLGLDQDDDADDFASAWGQIDQS
jgi:hypothetical protein